MDKNMTSAENISDPVEEAPDDISSSSSFVVNAAITAELERNPKLTGNPFDVSMGKPWNLKNQTAIDFIAKIEEKFRRKNKFHGYFSYPTINSTPGNLRAYIDGGDTSFVHAVGQMMQSLKLAGNAVERGNLVGGNVVFVHYKASDETDDHGRFLVVMVAKKSGFDFDSDLQPKKLSPIDTDALRQAALFDLNLFSVSYPKNDGDTYLHFIEGKSKSDFFKEALGCDDAVPNKESVSNLHVAVRAFVAECKLARSQRDKIFEKVVEHLKKRASEKKPTGLSEIQQVIDKELPVGHKHKGKFCIYVNENKYEINSVFEPTTSGAVKGELVDISDLSKNFSCKVKVSSLGYEGSDKPVLLDDDLSYIRIPLDDEARNSIISAIGKKNDSAAS
ncbi:nucleoid-associated protein [Pseudomonas sp. Pse35]|uniref:nucleoid-associated protein n=1 Tax=Pseudomonas sp. Pse35 TaxID=2926021 RepID=UPI0021CA6191|nr:nucleoid-associated protein [Pseudomonas sp. Pse35]